VLAILVRHAQDLQLPQPGCQRRGTLLTAVLQDLIKATQLNQLVASRTIRIHTFEMNHQIAGWIVLVFAGETEASQTELQRRLRVGRQVDNGQSLQSRHLDCPSRQ